MATKTVRRFKEPIEAPFKKVVAKVLNVPIAKEISFAIPGNYPRSPLRYPGGKNRAVKEIFSYIPENEKILCSPFLGGGSVELACSTRMQVSLYL